MPTTYSTSLRTSLIGTGELAGTWGTVTNANIGTLLEQAITGVVDIVMGNANYTLTALNAVSDESRNAVLRVTSSVSLTATRQIIIPNVDKVYVVINTTTGGQSIRVQTATPTSYVDIPNGYAAVVSCDGSAVVSQATASYNPATNAVTATTGAFTSVSGAVTATGTSTSRTLANRFADSLNLKDFGAVGDGTTDDTAAVNAWIAAVLSTGNTGYAPAGNYKVTSPILIDYVSVATTGFTLVGAGVQRTVFTSTVTSGAAFELYSSGGTGVGALAKRAYYPKITQLAFYATTVGPTLRIGKYNFYDQQNLVRLEIWCSNSSNDASARCIEMNSCYGCHIEFNGSCGDPGPAPYLGAAAGICLSLRETSFSQFFVSVGSTANPVTGAILGTATGVYMSDSFNFGNEFIAPDLEVVDVSVRITNGDSTRNTFLGGQYAYKSYGVVATAGSNNVFANPNINATTPFFQSGVNAVGVSRVDATSLFNYQTATPTSASTVTSQTVRLLRLTHAATIATLTIALPPDPFDGQVFDIYTTNAVTALTLTPTPFDTITTLPVTSGASFFFQASGNQWVRSDGDSSTGTGSVVRSAGPTLTTPALGTPSAVVLTNATGLPLTTGVTGTLPVANGGTGVTTSTGSGNNVLSVSPTLTGTLTAPVVTLANSSTFSDISNGYFVFRNSGNTAGILINTTNDGTAVFRNRANTADGAVQAGTATFSGAVTFQSAVEVQSTTAGVRFPNMTTTQKNAIASPQAGTVVFDTTLSKLTVYSGAAWQTITSV